MNYYENPILFGEHADPSILLDGEDYFMVFSSCFGNDGLMQMWHSTDLIGWEPLYYVLDSSIVQNAWAPELVKYKDTFYIYNYSPEKGCFVTTTKDIRKGNWSAPVFLENVEGIDPGHVTDTEGKRFLIMSGNRLYPLSEDGMRVTGPGIKICDEWKIPDEIDVEGSFPEGPKFFKRNGYYYLTIAQGGTVGPATSHGTVSYRSKDLLGPYELSPYTPVIHTESKREKWWSKGHSTVFRGKDGNWYMVYHAIENGNRYAGRICLLMPVVWDGEDWFYVSPEDAVKIPCPHKAEKKELSQYLQFHKGMEELGPLYNFCTREGRNRTRFTEYGMELTGCGASEPGMNGMITFQHQSHRFSYTVSLRADSEAVFSLGFWFSETLNCGIYAKGNMVGLFKHGKKQFEQENIRLSDEKMDLRMISRDGIVSFWYKEKKEAQWHKMIHAYDVADWNPNVSGGFGYARSNLQIFGNGNVIVEKIVYENL